ncbi:MAG: UDP-2,3-diacylglucosamine diphosphatase [Candidatus Paceibacterota bacterium]
MEQTQTAIPITEVDTLIFSDVHLGSEVSRASTLLQVLKRYRFKRLIILGDMFDDLNFKRLKKEHWKLISYIRLLSNPKRNIEVVWVLGNHDEALADVMAHLVGIRTKVEYSWAYQGKIYFAIHGHQFDSFMKNNWLLSELATIFYELLQKLDKKTHRFSRYVKKMSKKWLRVSRKIAEGAVRHSKPYGADFVFCGHTHQELHWTINGIEYYNTGDWTSIPSSLITIDENGVKINHEN